jgi:serine/threonine protein phosphatase 1
MATFVIGDIHGNLVALNDLLQQVTPLLGRDDTLVFLGDYLDRGPDARGCVDRILDLQRRTAANVATLLGNHEDWFLRSLRDPTRHSWLLGMEALATVRSYSTRVAEQLQAAMAEAGPHLLTERIALPYDLLREAMPAAHIEFFESLRLYHRTPEALCVHAGLDPAISDISQQPREAMLWGTDDFVEAYAGKELVVYGHRNDTIVDSSGWPQPRIGKCTIGLDTIASGVLTAIRLPEMQVIQSARYWPSKAPSSSCRAPMKNTPGIAPFSVKTNAGIRHAFYRDVSFKALVRSFPAGAFAEIDLRDCAETPVFAVVRVPDQGEMDGRVVQFETTFRTEDGQTIAKQWPAEGARKAGEVVGMFCLPRSVVDAETRVVPNGDRAD